jgi:rubrerythrin
MTPHPDADHNLSPQRALALAVAIEVHNATRFLEWSHRLLAFDLDVAAFFHRLVEEEHAHAKELAELYKKVFGGTPDFPMDELPQRLREYSCAVGSIAGQFLIVEPRSVRALLGIALQIERFTRDFYTDLVKRTGDPAQAAVFLRLADYEAEHERAFERQLAALPDDSAKAKSVPDTDYLN